MGGHWITCPKCKHANRYPHDYMWFDKNNRLHDLNQWRCQNCNLLFKKAEGKLFDKHMKEEQEKMRCQKQSA
jgi:hypothetical protein